MGDGATAEDLRGLFTRLADHLEREIAGLERSLSPRRVHKTRVTARTLRSLLATLAPLLRSATQRRLRRDLRSLALQLESARTADVRRSWLEQLVTRSGALPPGAHRRLVALLDEAQAATRPGLRAHLASTTCHERRERILRDLRDRRLVAVAGGPEVAVAVVERLQRRWKKLRKAARHVHGADPERLHRLRLAAKHARYASEALMPLVGMDPRPWVRPLKQLQDCLGEHRDAVEALDWLAGLEEPAGPVLQGRLRPPLERLMKRRLKQVHRLAGRLEAPPFKRPRRSRPRVSRSPRPRAGRSARS